MWRWEERELINIAVRVEVGGEGINIAVRVEVGGGEYIFRAVNEYIYCV